MAAAWRRLRAAREPEPAWRPAATAGGAASCDTRAARAAAAEPANVDGARSSGAAHVAQFDGARGMMCLFSECSSQRGSARCGGEWCRECVRSD